ncbi:hypothetical protein Y032_0450g1681 [Ancylostoma ceylanicum]|uniref:Uncharacterized protein n=1 Tax=Ancylostoma ceylanicum TaxID=53326 RepID=A0A016WYP1_9BILA|nr:hypothetical protein Y032_0450g1681 [Ancylostoma ceylanicum]
MRYRVLDFDVPRVTPSLELKKEHDVTGCASSVVLTRDPSILPPPCAEFILRGQACVPMSATVDHVIDG